MVTLRECEGTVSREQRRMSGSSAAQDRLHMAGVARTAAAEAAKHRREIDKVMFSSL
jgi:hypothetical protein